MHRSPARHIRSMLAMLSLSAMLLAGCLPKHDRGPPQTLPSSAGHDSADDGADASASRGNASSRWPFWPVRMRLHPLTRLTNDPETGEQVIECRTEFEDAEGQTSKAVGQLTLRLYPDASAPAEGSGSLQTWNQDLRDLEVNRRQYDDVTRTYLFRLRLTQPLPVGAELRAFFLSSDGRRMNAETRVR